MCWLIRHGITFQTPSQVKIKLEKIFLQWLPLSTFLTNTPKLNKIVMWFYFFLIIFPTALRENQLKCWTMGNSLILNQICLLFAHTTSNIWWKGIRLFAFFSPIFLTFSFYLPHCNLCTPFHVTGNYKISLFNHNA